MRERWEFLARSGLVIWQQLAPLPKRPLLPRGPLTSSFSWPGWKYSNCNHVLCGKQCTLQHLCTKSLILEKVLLFCTMIIGLRATCALQPSYVTSCNQIWDIWGQIRQSAQIGWNVCIIEWDKMAWTCSSYPNLIGFRISGPRAFENTEHGN